MNIYAQDSGVPEGGGGLFEITPRPPKCEI